MNVTNANGLRILLEQFQRQHEIRRGGQPAAATPERIAAFLASKGAWLPRTLTQAQADTLRSVPARLVLDGDSDGAVVGEYHADRDVMAGLLEGFAKGEAATVPPALRAEGSE